MEKAVVATAVDGTPEVVINGETGLTVPAGESGQMAVAIRTLLADPERRSSMGHAGRRHVLRAFTEEQQVARTADFYIQALRGRGVLAEVQSEMQASSLEMQGNAPKRAGTAVTR